MTTTVERTPLAVERGQSQLFLDDEWIAERNNVTRRWHRLRKHPANPLFTRSGGEAQVYLSGTVLREPEPGGGGDPLFRMWYYARSEKVRWVAYARSRDGLSWEKPDLGVLPAGRGLPGNVVFAPPGWRLIDFSGVVQDPSPGAADEERYKLIVSADTRGAVEIDEPLEGLEGKHFVRGTSPDGWRWTFHGAFKPAMPSYPDRGCFTWDPFRGRFTQYARSRHTPPELVARGGPNYAGRAVGRGTSADFESWSTEWPQVLHATEEDPGGTEIYGCSAFPAGSQWIALAQMHHSLPHLAYIDMAIAHSRDGVRWTREDHVVLPGGDVGDWDRFNQCTATAPLRVGDELWVYYCGRSFRHREYLRCPEWRPEIPRGDSGPHYARIGLATIRLDGWCSLLAGYDGGTVLTRPMVLPRGELRVNARARWGAVTVEVLDEGGNPLPQAPRSAPVSADGVDLKVEWPGGAPPSSLQGRPVRLRFTIENAHLYSWTVA